MDVINADQTQSDDNLDTKLWAHMTKEDNEKAKCNKCKKVLSRKNGATSGLRKHLFQVHNIATFGVSSERSPPQLNALPPDERKKLDSLLINCIVQDGRSFDDMRRPGILKVFNHLAPSYTPPHRNTVQRRLKRLQTDHKLRLMKQLSKINSISLTCDFWTDKRLYSYICLTGHFITPNKKFISKILSFSSFHHRHTSTNICMMIKKELQELNIFEKVRSITTDGAANMSKIGSSFDDGFKQIWCIAHRLHLVVCNGLGLWIRKKKITSSSSKVLTTSSSSSSSKVLTTSSSSSLSNAPTTSSSSSVSNALTTSSSSSASNAVTTSNLDSNDIDSDEEDYTDDIQVNSRPSSVDTPSNSVEVLDESLETSNDLLNDKIDPNVIINKNFVHEETDNLTNDITDNWSIDVIDKLDPTTGEFVQEDIGILMKKCRSMVKLINKSCILMNYVISLKQQLKINLSIQLDCKSRWSSTHHLVEVMLIYRKIINKINSEKYDIGLNKKQTTKLTSIELDQFDWYMLEMIDYILKPFVRATNLVSGSQYPTIGIAYFAIIQIRDFLEDTTDTGDYDLNLVIQLKQLLLKQIDKYFIEKVEQWEIMKFYAYFDPIGFGCLTRRERRAIETHIIAIHEQTVSQDTDEEELNQSEKSQSNTTEKSKSSSISSMAKFLHSIDKKNLTSSAKIKSTKKNILNEEIISYRSLAQTEYNTIVDNDKDPDVMLFWQQHQYELKHLSKLSYDYLCTQATSVASESAFSTASYLLRKQRSRLTPENLSYSMFLKDKLDDKLDEMEF